MEVKGEKGGRSKRGEKDREGKEGSGRVRCEEIGERDGEERPKRLEDVKIGKIG